MKTHGTATQNMTNLDSLYLYFCFECFDSFQFGDAFVCSAVRGVQE